MRFTWNRSILLVVVVVVVIVFLDVTNTEKAAVGVVSALSTAPPANVAVTGVTLKLALDQQWAVADGPSSGPPQRFTCAASLDLVHRLRRDCQGVLVGRTTVERDDCSLTVRRVPLYHPEQPQPTRIIVDPRLSLLLPSTDKSADSKTSTSGQFVIPNYQIFRDGHPTILYHAVPDLDSNFLASLPDAVQCVYLPPSTIQSPGSDSSQTVSSSNYLSPTAIWNHLQQECGMSHILVEGGPTTALHFLPVVDRIVLVRAPLQFQHSPVVASHLSNELLHQHGFDFLGTAMSDVDRLEYWSRPHLSWPTPHLSDWP